MKHPKIIAILLLEPENVLQYNQIRWQPPKIKNPRKCFSVGLLSTKGLICLLQQSPERPGEHSSVLVPRSSLHIRGAKHLSGSLALPHLHHFKNPSHHRLPATSATTFEGSLLHHRTPRLRLDGIPDSGQDSLTMQLS